MIDLQQPLTEFEVSDLADSIELGMLDTLYGLAGGVSGFVLGTGVFKDAAVENTVRVVEMLSHRMEQRREAERRVVDGKS